MKKYLLILLLLLPAPAYAQRISDLPNATFLTGSEYVPLVQNGVTKKSTTSQFMLSSVVIGISSGGTGLNYLGPAYFALQSNSNGLALTYDVLHFQGGGTGLTFLGAPGSCLLVNSEGNGYTFGTCGGSGPPPVQGDFIITETSDPIITETGDNIVTETSS